MTEKKELTERQATKVFWEDFHPACKLCKNECKQSSKVVRIFCPNYVEAK